jgi:DNA-binding PadR family transcriptional regulator
MADQDLFSGLIRLHVLHHAAEERIFGLGMIRELRRHGYRIGPGTLYPLLHRLEEKRYLSSRSEIIDGKLRRSYRITTSGRRALEQARRKVRELFNEMFEEHQDGSARLSPSRDLPRAGGEGSAGASPSGSARQSAQNLKQQRRLRTVSKFDTMAVRAGRNGK